MSRDAYRIIDANLNRANEGLRTLEEYARMVLNDAELTRQIKQLRHDLGAAATGFDQNALLAARDTPGDVGTEITNDSEQTRSSTEDVAAAACKRIAESLRCIEEYGKIVAPDASARFKQIRYQMYATEQNTMLPPRRVKNISTVLLHVLVTESFCRRPWMETCEELIAASDAVRNDSSFMSRVFARQKRSDGPVLAIQLREKNLSDRELLNRAQTLRKLTQDHGVLFIVNDRPDIASLCHADGLHLGQDDLSMRDLAAFPGPHVLYGKSTHTLEQVRAAIGTESNDYIAVGPMFPSKTKPAEIIPGPPLLHAALDMFIPNIVAIGGITLDNLPVLKHTKPFAVAASQAIIASDDPRHESERFLRALATMRIA